MAANQSPRQVGLDTNILRHPTPRRFFLSFMEHIGARAHLSETVQSQIIWEVAREEETHWANKRLRKGVVDQGREDAVLSAVANAAQEWAAETLLQPSAVITPHTLSAEEADVMRHLYNNMPDRCFRDPNASSTLADRRIIAETAAAGVPIIISQNMNSIVQRNVNAWLREKNFLEQYRIMFSDEFVDGWLQMEDRRGRRRAALLVDMVCGACLPERQGSVDKDVRTICSFLGWMCAKDAPLRKTGGLVEALLKEEGRQALMDRCARVREKLPRVTRSIETDRLQRVDQAAEDAGWTP